MVRQPLNQAETSRRSFSVALSSSENVLRLAKTPQRDVPDYDVEVSTTFLEH